MHVHDDYAPHSHEVRSDHLGVPQVGSPDYDAYMAKQSQQTRDWAAEQSIAAEFAKLRELEDRRDLIRRLAG